MASPRENLFAAIVTQLETISITNGYWTDCHKVYRVDVLPDQFAPSEKNVLEVLESLTPEDLTFIESGAAGGNLSKVNVVVSGIIKDGTINLKSSERHTTINNFLSDTIAALMADPTFSGNCKQSMVTQPVVFVDSERPEAMFNLVLKCVYAYSQSEL